MQEAIDGNQFAFVKDRNIMDCILLVMRLLTTYHKTKKSRTLIKLDLEKAYTDWEFLDYILACKGFRSKWDPGFTDVYLLLISPFLLTARLKVFSLPLAVFDRGSSYLLFCSL